MPQEQALHGALAPKGDGVRQGAHGNGVLHPEEVARKVNVLALVAQGIEVRQLPHIVGDHDEHGAVGIRGLPLGGGGGTPPAPPPPLVSSEDALGVVGMGEDGEEEEEE